MVDPAPDTHAGTVALLPGSGSSGDFLARAFAPIIGTANTIVVSHESGDAQAAATVLAQAYDQCADAGVPITRVIGVSIGAHAAAWWASRLPLPPPDSAQSTEPNHHAALDLVLALPAWTGPPDAIATITAHSAERLATTGIDSELATLHQQFPGDWVVAELDSAWRHRELAPLATALRGTAASAAPTIEDLARIAIPTCVVALADDPLHPASVARQWTDAIPSAVFASVSRHAPATDRAVFGQAVCAAWLDLPASASQ